MRSHSLHGRRTTLASHRSQVTLVFCDMREFLVAERAGPGGDEGLNEYHAALGKYPPFEGTLSGRGDGLVVLSMPLP